MANLSNLKYVLFSIHIMFKRDNFVGWSWHRWVFLRGRANGYDSGHHICIAVISIPITAVICVVWHQIIVRWGSQHIPLYSHLSFGTTRHGVLQCHKQLDHLATVAKGLADMSTCHSRHFFRLCRCRLTLLFATEPNWPFHAMCCWEPQGSQQEGHSHRKDTMGWWQVSGIWYNVFILIYV